MRKILLTMSPPFQSRISDISPDLLERVKNLDDQESWNEFHKLCAPFILSLSIRQYGLSKEDAKDVVQETLLKVAKYLPGFNSDPAAGSFRGWLRQIVRTQVIERWRREKKHLENRVFENRSPEDSFLFDRLRIHRPKISTRFGKESGSEES